MCDASALSLWQKTTEAKDLHHDHTYDLPVLSTHSLIIYAKPYFTKLFPDAKKCYKLLLFKYLRKDTVNAAALHSNCVGLSRLSVMFHFANQSSTLSVNI